MVLRRLSIEVEFNLADKLDEQQYSDTLKRHEMPRGILISVTFYVTNMDSQPYSIYIEKISTMLIEPNSGKPFIILNERPIGAGNIFPEQKTVLHKTTIRMPFEGNAEFEIILKLYNSEEEIEYFMDNGNQFLGTKSWIKPFKVVPPEQIEIIKLLKDILNNTRIIIDKLST
ncbi:MAG TPA: hypothetical protein VN704_10915 [Verrucomicrobiae bacterium]|nr:hypothetical protein [Verrucomicrobiae bacterium]